METNEIIENNKLIALFMECECNFVPVYKHLEDSSPKRKQVFSTGVKKYSEDKLKYNTSYDWLMPVVQKIKEYHNGTDPLTDKQISDLMQIIIKLNNCFVARCGIDINDVYKAVIEFIKWYNVNK